MRALLALPLVLLGLALPSASPASAADPAASCKLPNRSFLSEGTTDWNNFPRPVGALKAAILFRGSWDINAEMARLRPAEQWYLTSSYGRYQLTLKPNNRPVLMANSLVAPQLVGDVSVSAATTWGTAARSADPYFDFSDVDMVFLVDRNTSRSYAEFENVVLDGKTIKAGAVLGTDWGSHRHLLLAHEGGHIISMPDLYGGSGGHGYIGGWDLMGNLGGVAPDHFAWHKWKLGWLDDDQISCVRTFNTAVEETLTPIELAGGKKSIVVRYSDTRAYVAEVRARRGNDSAACDVGVLVYSVDSAGQSGSGPVLVKDARPGSGGCGGNELNDGAYDVGQTFTDGTNQVKIQVMSQSGENYVVRATLGTANPDPPGQTVWFDDFSADRGWTVSSTATAGQFERAVPSPTSYNGVNYQLSGTSSLVTGPLAGTDAGSYDLDGGTTTATSPLITLPASSKLSLRYYLAHADNSSSDDYFRVRVNGTTVFTQSGAASVRGGVWGTATADLASFAGQQVRISVEAADLGTGSLVESAVDDVRITAPQVDPPTSFTDDFSTDRGWTVSGAATTGRWARGVPANTSYSGTTCQLSNGTSALVTGLAGGDCAVDDVDGGVTTATSPVITVPASGSLKFDSYLAHLDNASSADYLRLRIGSTVVWQRMGSASNVSAVWSSATVDLSAYAGQQVQLVFEAADNDSNSMVDAAIDNVVVS